MKAIIKAALAFFIGTSIAMSVSTCHSRNSKPEKETIKSFEEASTSLSDANLNMWIASALPEIRRSHNKIMACEKRLK